MISNMQYPREMYGKGGLTSLKEARNLLEKYALPGESLAYINDEEAKFLKYMGGAGIPVNSSGVPSYFKKFFKSVTKPIAKVLDKIVPNEIKPALPFIAAALPFMLPAGFAIGSLGTAASRAVAMAAANAGAQLSQEGAAKYGINPFSVGLSALGGYLSAPGVGTDIGAGKIVGNIGDKAITAGDFATQFPGYTGPKTLEALSQMSDVATTGPTFLQGTENLARGIGQFGSDTFKKAQESIEKITGSGSIEDISKTDIANIAKGVIPGQATAVGDMAYMSAQKALDEYDQQQAALGAMGVANTEGRKAAIRKAMGLAGYTDPEIDTTLLKFNFANGGRVGYQMGGASKPPSMPINPDMLAMAIFGKSYDQLTYTQKSAINDMLPNKKAEGGIMDLGGLEMDLRAKGGFVPIGRKEKADDVPARLSKNEFVMTANAVRGAGKGDVKKGAKRMYDLMRQYEAMA